MSNLPEFLPRRILITGASSGFGMLAARALCAAGHTVFATMRDLTERNAGPAASLRAASANLPGALTCVELDVTSDASVAQAADQIERQGGVDSLVLNAGVAAAGLSETFTAATVQRLFEVNVVGAHRVLWSFLPQMRAIGGGQVVFITSTIGREVTPFLGAYCATKAALESLAEGWRYELNAIGIGTVVIQPGTFPTTSILANLLPPDAPERAAAYGSFAEVPGQFLGGIGAMVAAGQAPDPQRVADAVVAAFASAGPVRRPLDPSGFDGAARINAVASEVQSDLLERFGLGYLGTRSAGP